MSAEIIHYDQTIGLEEIMAAKARAPFEWQQPEMFDLATQADRREVQRRLESGQIRTTFDPIDTMAEDRFEVEHPDEIKDERKRELYIADIKRQGLGYGNWFEFPWSRELSRFHDKEVHRAVRTNRFQDLNTSEEQRLLAEPTILTAGLSVGSSVLDVMRTGSIGGRHIIGDSDTVSGPNLGRMQAGNGEIGAKKLSLAARKMSEVDPYVEQIHFPEGFTPAILGQLASMDIKLIIEEVDNMSVKAQFRQFAAEKGIALIMASDVGKNSVIDVERHDLEVVKPFGGRVDQRQFEAMQTGQLTPEDMRAIPVQIIGMENISERMMRSYEQVGKTLAGVAQLGTTAITGGGLTGHAAREIILGRDLKSGRYALSPDQFFGLQSEASAH